MVLVVVAIWKAQHARAGCQICSARHTVAMSPPLRQGQRLEVLPCPAKVSAVPSSCRKA